MSSNLIQLIMDPQQVYQAPGSKHHFVNNVELIVFYIIVTLSL